MLKKIKEHWFKEQLRKFIMGFQLISSLVSAIFLVAVLYFAMQYFVAPSYTDEQIFEAQKIGNWDFPDDKYILKNIENLSVQNKNIGAVTIKDNQSGNELMVFEAGFSQTEILKIKDAIQNKLLENYGLGGFYLKNSGNRAGRIGEEFVYSTVGWSGEDSPKAGIIGNMDCIKNKQSGSYIIAFVFNSSAKYSNERALGFIDTLNCPPGGDSVIDDIKLGDKVDTDNDDLTDKVEKMLLSNPYNKDTDGDGYNDFEEIQSGYSPMLPRPWDKYSEEEFAKVKEDIKFVSNDVYDKLFPVK